MSVRAPVAALVVATFVLGCATSGPPPAAPSAVPTTGTAAIPSPATAAPVATPRPGALEVDERLIDVLPAAIDDVPLEFSPEASEETAAGPPVAGVDALAYALATRGDDLLIASVVRLHDGAFDEAFFREWRATYTAGVCAQVGGVRPAAAEAEIGGRRVHIGSCVNGGHVYFTWLEEPGVIVSAFGLGDGRFGERLMESLRG